MSIAAAHAALTGPGSPFEIEERVIDGRRLRVWKHAAPTTGAQLTAARAFGERTFLVHEDERVGFEAFHRAVAVFAAELVRRGLAPGDRAALVMRNLPEWAVAFYAVTAAGGVATPLNAWWTAGELAYALKDSGAKLLVVDAERLARIGEVLGECPDLRHGYAARAAADLPANFTPLEAVIGPPGSWERLPDRPLPDVALGPEDNATLFYTSGTTGAPKGALGTHRNMLSNAVGAACVAARAFLRRGEAPPAPDPDAPQPGGLVSIPFFHVTGCFAVLSPALQGGAKLAMMRRWDAEAAMRLIERERLTSAGGVPAIAWELVEHPARHKYDLSSLQTISYGGAPAPPELVRRILQEFPGAVAGSGWGMTETSGMATQHAAEDYAHRPDSAGPAAPVGDLKIMSPAGDRELPAGEVGELWFRGPQVVRGYWNKPEATAETFVDGWVRTGDLARVDGEGFLFIVDRAKDMVIRGGENIYCVEVENVLYEHPAVVDAAVIGLPHRTLGEEPAAVVTLKPGAAVTGEELRRHVAGRLAAFKTPVEVRVRSEPLPRNANGKILKPALRELFGKDKG
ncbi:class I adenylate-forming enzyme family protein [Phenylobacterium sp.]|uniref:class I adenylate-forming enzyme family protein n=1 Tax=Phenylobacterium sp. TaxID=1871053 RepID=UPI002F4040CA